MANNNGIITKIWGGATWTANHAITFGYPINPSYEQKKNYKNYFIMLGEVLPCLYCRNSYKEFISSGKTKLTDDVLNDRNSLTKWFYDLHNAVNNKLEIDYGVTYEDVVNKYESFRARCNEKNIVPSGCTVPLDYKAFSFRKLYCSDAPIISINIAKKFIKIAKLRGINKKYFIFLKLVIYLNNDINELKKQKCWESRNLLCCKIIQYMRKNAIPSIETNGSWMNTPSLYELLLLMFLSSNLGKSDLLKMTDHI